MENLVFTTFTTEAQAMDGYQKLRELEQVGDIILYNVALLKKTNEKDFIVLLHDGPDVEALPAEGMLLGSVIGLLGGPIGVAIGMLTGTLAGTAAGETSDEVSQQFLAKAKERLLPGDYAIVMDVEEDDTLIVDTYMAPFQGTTVHSPVESEYEENDHAQWKALNTEIDHEEQALQTAVAKDKAALSAKLDALKKKRTELRQKIKEKLSTLPSRRFRRPN